MINFEKQEWYDKSDSRAIPISSYNLNRIETAIGECVDSINSQTQIITGSYTGDGTENRKIDIGATPKAVIIGGCSDGIYDSNAWYYKAYFKSDLFLNDGSVENGFNVTVKTFIGGNSSSTKTIVGSNVNGYSYNYIAFI